MTIPPSPPPPPPPPPQNTKFVTEEIVAIENLFLNLNKYNLESTAQQISKLMEGNPNCPYLYEFYISQFICMSYFTKNNNASLYISFLNLLTNVNNLNYSKLLKVLIIYLSRINTLKSECLLKEMWKLEMIPPKLMKYINKMNNEIKNDTNLLKILRKDNLDELQEISSQNDFKFKQIIDQELCKRWNMPSLYASLIDYAAFFGSIKCFKFLLLNEVKPYNTLQFAVAGGNLEIIHLCEQDIGIFWEMIYDEVLKTAIQYHKNDVFYYFYEKKLGKVEERKNY